MVTFCDLPYNMDHSLHLGHKFIAIAKYILGSPILGCIPAGSMIAVRVVGIASMLKGMFSPPKEQVVLARRPVLLLSMLQQEP